MSSLQASWAGQKSLHHVFLPSRSRQYRAMPPRPNLEQNTTHILFRTASSTSRPKKGPKLKKDVPLFDVPKVVLDLDAENSPYVRPYDEAIEAAETARWRGAHASIDALTDRLAVFAEEADQVDTRMKAVARNVLSPWRVQDRDVLSTALMSDKKKTWAFGRRKGDETKNKANQQHEGQAQEVALLSELFYQNGITDRATAEPATAIQFLLHRQRFALDKREKSITKRELQSALARCQSFTEVRRLLSLATQTAAGSTTVAACAGFVERQLRPMLYAASTDEKTTASTSALPSSSGGIAVPLSTMLLNLSHNFEDKGGVKLGSRLCGLGLCAAAATMEPAAMRRFLQMGLSEGYFSDTGENTRPNAQPEDDTFMPDITTALLTIRSSLQRSQEQPTVYKAARSELFTLLTGHGFVQPRMVELGSSSSPPSFRAALSHLQRPGAHAWQQYFGVLAELGAVRTLWREAQLMRSHSPGSGAEAIIDTETLVTAVRRHGRLAAARSGSPEPHTTTGTRDEEQSSSTSRAPSTVNDKTGRKKDYNSSTAVAAAVATQEAESGSMADLRAIATYEKHLQSTSTSRQPYPMLPTVRSLFTTPPQPMATAELARKGHEDEQVKAAVVEAFSKETEQDMLSAVFAGLALDLD